jgi:small subunit ribosomal protein S6
LYEGLFLINQANTPDLPAALEHVREILARAEAEVLVLAKWDDRKLVYPIKGQKRGLYILSYFKARGVQLANIDRDCNLSERILRAMLIRAEHVGDAELEQAKRQAEQTATEVRLRARERTESPAQGSEAQAEPAAVEGAEDTTPTAEQVPQ